ALKEKTGSDPAPSACPTSDRGRREELLAESAGGLVQIRYARHALLAELAIGGDGHLHRALDLRANRSFAIEIAGKKDLLEKGLDFVMPVAKDVAETLLQSGGKILAHEVAIDFAGNVLRGDGLLHDDVDDLDAVEVTRLAKEGLRGIIMLLLLH